MVSVASVALFGGALGQERHVDLPHLLEHRAQQHRLRASDTGQATIDLSPAEVREGAGVVEPHVDRRRHRSRRIGQGQRRAAQGPLHQIEPVLAKVELLVDHKGRRAEDPEGDRFIGAAPQLILDLGGLGLLQDRPGIVAGLGQHPSHALFGRQIDPSGPIGGEKSVRQRAGTAAPPPRGPAAR
jgi:hypothetical protein